MFAKAPRFTVVEEETPKVGSFVEDRESKAIDSLISRLTGGSSSSAEKKLDHAQLAAAALEALQSAYNSVMIKYDEKTSESTISTMDYDTAAKNKSSLLFGEITPSGVTKILDALHLDAGRATTLCDLGMGLGKLAMQAFLQYPNLTRVVGVELAYSRSIRGMAALRKLGSSATRFSTQNYEMKGATRVLKPVKSDHIDDIISVNSTIVTESTSSSKSGRVLEFRRQSLFEADDLIESDIVICETKIQDYEALCKLLNRMKPGARILTYENLTYVYMQAKEAFPFVEICVGDRYETSWAAAGHAFYLYKKAK